jgi:hypothetical protein
MIFPVRMMAFHGSDVVRSVDLPINSIEAMPQDDLLDLIYKYGQNDFQPVEKICSVSVGDVIELPNGENHLVVSFGFRRLDKKEYDEYRTMDRDARWFFAHT